MRTLLAAVLLVVTALVCPTLWAGVGEGLAERIQDLNLTDAQEAKIGDIRKECQTKIREAGKELAALVKEEVEKIRDVLTPAQKQKILALKEEREERRLEGLAHGIAHLKDLDLTEDELAKIQDIRKEYRPRTVKAMEAFKGLLSGAQNKAREEGLTAGKTRREVLAALNLTNDQKEKVSAACKEVGTTVREELEKIRDVLTAEQQAKLGELKDERRERTRDQMARRIADFKDLNLTDEQKTKIAEIRKEFRPRIQEAGNRMRAAVRDQLEMIAAIIKG